MKVFLVYAHPNPLSLNATLKDHAIAVLQREGHEVRVSDLYAMKWKAVADAGDFPERDLSLPLHYVTASGEAYEDGTQSRDIAEEQEKLKWADAVVFQFPLWWFGLPAILKGWFDRVFAYKFAYGYRSAGKHLSLWRRRSAGQAGTPLRHHRWTCDRLRPQRHQRPDGSAPVSHHSRHALLSRDGCSPHIRGLRRHALRRSRRRSCENITWNSVWSASSRTIRFHFVRKMKAIIRTNMYSLPPSPPALPDYPLISPPAQPRYSAKQHQPSKPKSAIKTRCSWKGNRNNSPPGEYFVTRNAMRKSKNNGRAMLATGMEHGMEASYVRLEATIRSSPHRDDLTQARPGPAGAPHSRQSLSQFQIPSDTSYASGNPTWACQHAHLPAMVRLVRQHVAKHLHPHRPRRSPPIPAKQRHAPLTTTTQRLRQHLFTPCRALS